MSALSVILIILTILFVIMVPVVFLIIKYWKFPITTETLVIFEDTSRSEGSAIASLISKEIGKGGRVILNVMPKDIKESVMNQIHLGKAKMKPRIYFIIG